MTELSWPDEYSVGVDDFDFHHKRIFSMLNELRESKDMDLKMKYDFISDLIRHIDYHLSREEYFFEKFDYKDKKRHIKEHNKYRARMKKFNEKQKKGTLNIEELADFLERWWIEHITKEDKKYRKIMNENGVY